MIRLAAPRRLISLAIVLVLIAVGVFFWVANGSHHRHYTAYFTESVGLYKGNDVRIRGVNVGVVDAVQQQGDRVRVKFSVNADEPLPANVEAVIIAPTLVTGRFIQLTPQYASGAPLPDGGSIPITRTAVPVEWDQILQQLDQVATDLGPNGANSQGALADLVTVGAANLDGQGKNLHDTVAELSQALTTLSDGRDDLFGTLRNLQSFVTALKDSDDQVALFNKQLDQVSTVLADNRQELGQTLTALDHSFGQIRDFVADNRTLVATDLQKLNQLATTVASQRQNLADILQVGPGALSNLNNIYDPVSGGLTGAVAPINANSASLPVCTLFSGLNLNAAGCAALLGKFVDPSVPTLSKLIPTVSPFERNGACNQVTAAPGPALTDVRTVTCSDTGPSSLANLMTPGGSR